MGSTVQHGLPQRAMFWIRALIVSALLYLGSQYLDYTAIQAAFSRDLLTAVFVLQLPLLLTFFVTAYRHALLVAPPRPPLRIAVTAVLLSTGLNLILPARLAEFIKATYLREHAKVPLDHGLSAVLVERIVDVYVLVGIGVLAASSSMLSIDSRLIYVTAFALLALGLMLPVVVNKALHWSWFATRKRAYPVVRLLAAIEARAKGAYLVNCFILGLVVWISSLASAIAFLTVQPFVELHVAQMVAVYIAGAFAGAIPIVPGGFGTYEAAAAYMLVEYGAQPGQAIVLAVTLHVGSMLLPLVMLPYFLVSRSTGLRTLIRDSRALIGRQLGREGVDSDQPK